MGQVESVAAPESGSSMELPRRGFGTHPTRLVPAVCTPDRCG
jgi:hypothetical protein